MPRDLTRACLDGYTKSLDRCPSDSDSRAAFTLGRWARMRGHGPPLELTAEADTLQGDIFRLSLEDGGLLALQCWPHPSNPGQLLVVVT